MITSLFLHMGPGFHAKIENQFFAKTHPHIAFWNQPLTTSFEELTNATLHKIEEIYKVSKSPVDLYTHSFGGQLALCALLNKPKIIGKIKMLNSAFDPFECFLNLSDLDEESKTKLRSSETSEKMQLIFTLASKQDFSNLYWKSLQKKQQYDQAAANYENLDVTTFAQVFSSFLDSQYYKKLVNKELQLPVAWNNPVTILRSVDDNLIKKPSDCDDWKTLFKAANIVNILNSGHYSLFDNSEAPTLFFK